MLLPSTLGHGPRPRLQRFAAYSHDGINQLTSPITPTTPRGIDGTCRALQSALGTRASESRSPGRRQANSTLHANARIVKRPPPRPRNLLKRRRDDDSTEEEDMSDAESDMKMRIANDEAQSRASGGRTNAPSTPKRRRRAPATIPFGLERDDFLNVDEGIDDAMREDAMREDAVAARRPTLDEGYGSMDVKVDMAGDPFSQTKYFSRPQLGADLFAPQPDSDAMSLSTPASDLAAMALSPAAPGNQVPSPIPGLLNFGPIPTLAVTPPCQHPVTQDLGMDDPDLPTLPTTDEGRPVSREAQSKSYFQPRPVRTAGQIHSDPVEYHEAAQSEPSSVEDRAWTKAYDWTHADDRALVDIVVEKLRLKKGDWEDCARLLGADNGASLGRRWKELVKDGCVGLKFRYSDVGFTAEDESRSGRGTIKRGRMKRTDIRALRWT